MSASSMASSHPFNTGEGYEDLQQNTPKDDTIYVALVIMGIIVPVIFISVFALVCIRRHKETKARRASLLLRDAADMAIEDYPYTMRGVSRSSLKM